MSYTGNLLNINIIIYFFILTKINTTYKIYISEFNNFL